MDDFTTEHFNRSTESEVQMSHKDFATACDFARRMSDAHDGSATAYWHRKPTSFGAEWELVRAAEFVFGKVVADSTPESAGS